MDLSTNTVDGRTWLEASKNMKIAAYLPGDVAPADVAPVSSNNGRNGRDERTKIDAHPEDALRALVKTRKRG